MEFFIPGLLLFLVAIAVTAWLSPKATPMVAAVLSIVFLIYGINDHYRLFASEYRLSTWQQSLMTFAPFIMMGAIILFIIYGILGFFTSASVPVPNMPIIPNIIPNSANNTKSNGIVDSLNRISNNLFNKGNNNKGNNKSIADSLGLGNSNKKNNGTSRSFLETI